MWNRPCGLLRELDPNRSRDNSRFDPVVRKEVVGFAASLAVVLRLAH
jgi:hypothetical protein